jgi:hypothetical protein
MSPTSYDRLKKEIDMEPGDATAARSAVILSMATDEPNRAVATRLAAGRSSHASCSHTPETRTMILTTHAHEGGRYERCREDAHHTSNAQESEESDLHEPGTADSHDTSDVESRRSHDSVVAVAAQRHSEAEQRAAHRRRRAIQLLVVAADADAAVAIVDDAHAGPQVACEARLHAR